MNVVNKRPSHIAIFRRSARFAVVGALNTTVDIGVFWLLAVFLDWPILLANTCSYSAGVVNSFVWNKYWTFGDVNREDKIIRQFPMFAVFNVIGLCISNILVAVFVTFLPPIGAKMLAVAGTVAWNYWTSARFVYRDNPKPTHKS